MAESHGTVGSAETAGMALGRIMTVEFYECDSRVLADAGRVEAIFLEAAARSGATVIDSNFHEFKPQGVSGVVVISESHFAVHAWPEHDYAAVDLFTCGDKVDFEAAIRAIGEGFGTSEWIVSSMMHRGIVGTNGIERLVPVFDAPAARFSLSWRERFDSSHAYGLSAAIDVYECGENCWNDRAAHPARFAGLAELLGCASNGELRFDSEAEGGCTFEFPLEKGRISGRCDSRARNLYFDIFVGGFFDPRVAAEYLVEAFQGRYYRLQPQVRQ